MNNTITLKAGDTARAAAWAPHISVEVFTVEQFYADNYPGQPEKIAEGLQRAIDNHHDLASAILPVSGLYSDRAYAAKKLAEAQAAAERAVVLKAGDQVEIAGRRYTVKFPQKQDAREYPNLSDPIHFVPVR